MCEIFSCTPLVRLWQYPLDFCFQHPCEFNPFLIHHCGLWLLYFIISVWNCENGREKKIQETSKGERMKFHPKNHLVIPFHPIYLSLIINWCLLSVSNRIAFAGGFHSWAFSSENPDLKALYAILLFFSTWIWLLVKQLLYP